MNVSSGDEQSFRRPTFVVERQADGRNRHERRRTARQQHQERLIGFELRCQPQRVHAGSFAGRVRQGMSSGDEVATVEAERSVGGPSRRRARRSANHETGANVRAEALDGHTRHRRRGLAGRHQHDAAVYRAIGIQRPTQERAGVSRAKPGLNNGEEIASETRVRFCQWVCLGSDQAERPVRTSNFLRSELTS